METHGAQGDVGGILATAHERDRGIIRLALEGASTSDISAAVCRSERTVQRVLRRMEEMLVRMADPAVDTSPENDAMAVPAAREDADGTADS